MEQGQVSEDLPSAEEDVDSDFIDDEEYEEENEESEDEVYA